MTEPSRDHRSDGVVFPTELDDLTPDVVGAALADHMPGVVVDHLEIAAAKRAGEGVASTADRVVVDLTYAPGTGGDLPNRLILKTMLASPHAPRVMYENEVRFYREIRDELDIETPQVFASHFDPPTGRFGLLLEDLTARGARFPSALEPVSLAELRSILGNLAALHAHFWDSPRFAAELSWVPTPTSGGMFDVFDSDRPRTDRGPGGAPPVQSRTDRAPRPHRGPDVGTPVAGPATTHPRADHLVARRSTRRQHLPTTGRTRWTARLAADGARELGP